jgi:hypothetical protein
MATFTPQDVIDAVRDAVQDTRAASYRYSDEHLLSLCNQTLRRICTLRPDLFAYVTDVAFVEGSRQSAPADSVTIIDVLGTADGTQAINEVNRDSLDLIRPGWQAITPGTPTDWMRHPRNRNVFFVYPPSSDALSVTIEYSQSPPNYALDTPVELLPDAYFPVVVDGVVWLAESIDNEHVNSGRAKLFQDAFMQGLGLTIQTKPVTDTESGGQDPKMYK